MEYVLLVISPLLVCIKTLIQGRYTKTNNPSIKSTFFFNAIFSLIALILLGAIYLRTIPNITTIIFGLIMGLITTLFQAIYLNALKKGPISISGIIISLSILLPTVYGLIFLNESINAFKIIGIVLIVISLILLNISKENDKKINYIYLILIFIAFLLSGTINIFQSVFNALNVANERNELIFFMYCSSFIFSLIFTFLYNPKQKLDYKFNKETIISPILIGIILAVQNILLMYLLTKFDASIYFPVTSALNVIFITLSGYLLFKDKIKTTQIIGIIISIVAVVIINIVF